MTHRKHPGLRGLQATLLVGAALSCASVFCGEPLKQRIVFQGGGPVRSDLYISDPDGAHERQLVFADPSGYNPAFSRDGKWICFTSERGGSAEIYRIHPDSTGLEQLTTGAGFNDQCAFSPEGSRIVFVSTRNGGSANLWLLDLTSRRYSRLTATPYGNFRPSWSPDGRWIAFSSDRERPHVRFGPDRSPPQGSGCCGWELMQFTALYIVHPDGSALRRLTATDQIARSPKWSPDGRRITYYCDARTPIQQQSRTAGTFQIMSLDIGSGTRQARTTGPEEKVSPQYVDDSRIAFLMYVNGKAVLADTTGWRGAPRDITGPAWSPDGQQVVYARNIWDAPRNPAPILKVSSRDPRFDLYKADYSLAYSADGRRVLFAGSFVGDKALMVMNADGSDHRVLFDARDRNVGVVSPTWSRDDNYIAFTLGRFGLRNPNSPAQLALIRADGSQLRILTQGENNNGYPSFSPDGKRLVFRVLGKEQGLRLLSVDDGTITDLTTAEDNFPAWSPRGDRILFTGFRTGDFEIYTIRPDGTDLRQLTHDHGNDAHAVWSPDGSSILFTTSRTGWKDEGSGQAYGEIAVMRSDGTHVRQLTDDQWEEVADTWLAPAVPQ